MTAHRQSKGLGVRPLLSSVFLRAQSDERLSALARGGNRHAFAVIFERYASELRAHAARVVRPDRTEDVVQQAMLASWSALLDGAEVREVRAWLHRIVHNAALSTITKRGYDDVGLPESTAAPTLTEELAAGRLSVAEALAALARLPESQRAALTLTAVEGHSGSHAAQAMGLSENAFRQLVYRARSSVRSAISTITPLPLLNWAEGGAGAPEAVGIGLGSLATTAKIAAAVIAVTGASIELTARPHTHPHSSATHAQNTTLQPGRARHAQDQASVLGPRAGARESRHPQTRRLPPAAGQQPAASSHPEHPHGGSNQGNGARRLSNRPGSDSTPSPQPRAPQQSSPSNGTHSQTSDSGEQTRPSGAPTSQDTEADSTNQSSGAPTTQDNGTPDSSDQSSGAPTSQATATPDNTVGP